MLNRFLSAALVSAGLLVLAGNASAAPVNVGVLSCDVSKGIGHFIVEKQKMTCQFRPVSGANENYAGKISDFGIELGKIEQGHLVWSVLVAAPRDLPPNALSGR